MEWRQQSSFSCELAFQEAQRWIEEVTKKSFGSKSFRVALEDGVLLCDLINTLKPGIIKRLNRLSTPIAGLDNVNVFLKACKKLGLNEAQLFHPGDLQDVSTRVTVRREETNRRLKNVLITIYWLGRKAQSDPFYTGPQLNLKAFEGLLGIALSKALEESAQSRLSVRDSGYSEGWFSDREELYSVKQPSYRREDSVESLDSVESRTLSVASDLTLRAGSEGCCSDAEAEHFFRMAESSKSGAPIREKAHVPAVLRKKRQDYQQGSRSYAGHLTRSKSMGDITLEPIPQESDNSSSFDSLGPLHVHQRSDEELSLDPSALQRVQYEQLQHIRQRMKENEAKWHEDLSRWKSRRRSANSDLHKKLEEREQIELITTAGGASGIRTAHLTGVPEESSSMPGPMSDAGSSVSSSGWSTSALGLANGATSALTRGTVVETSDSAQKCTGVLSSHPSAVVSEQTSQSSLTAVDAESDEQQGPDFSLRSSLLESFYAGGARMSATLPRGFRRSEGCSRLSTGVTPRPFGAKPSKMPTLPKVYSVDDSHKSLISGHRDHSAVPSFLGGQGKVTASAGKGHSRSSTHPINPKEEETRDGRSSAPPMNSYATKVTMTTSIIQTSPPAISEIRDVKVGQSEMRVCLNQKPNSGRDFGFKAHWDSVGAYVKSVQAGSPAELYGLLMGDEIVALGGRRVDEMNYEQFKSSMETAQRNGTLLMDIRRHGQNDWGSGQPSLPYQSHKIINLTSATSTLIGRPEHFVPINTSSNSSVETVGKTQVNGQPANGVLSKMMNGSIQDNAAAVRNKDYELVALKNRRRKLEFFMQKGGTVSSWVYLCGGSESDISDLQVPSISTTSSSWSWDHEEERRRQEKWQMEQERLLQEKYRRDQEKLEEEWRRAQQEVYGEEYCGLEEQKTLDVLSNGNPAPHNSPPFYNQSSATFSVTFNENVAAAQNRQACVQTAAGHQSIKAEDKCDSPTKTLCSEESYGFAKLTVSDRTKSKSTPALEALHKQDAKEGCSKKKGQLSQAEKERLQILDEMRKKTPLHTDSSWIRQRNASINKETITVGTSIRRYESMDNLHTTNSWSRQSYTSGLSSRPHSALGSSGSYRSGRSSLGPGSAIFSTGVKLNSNTTTPEPTGLESRPNSQQQGRLVSGRRMCSRCEQPLGKGAAMVIDSLELCFHIGCFKCVSCRTELGRGPESGAQVRVRHRQLFCNTCYCRIRVCSSISK
ncbi:LIM domain only protein 7b isoform X2 [Danio rerio]|uniref:LIM domain only protein 7b isoform X2 n=1 Tax=Danio rerio TaxID=7955 RepID=A0AC58J4L0_DANRE